MADKKISELVSITGSATAADDFFVVVDTSGAVTHKISREELNNAIEQDVLENISITNLTSDLNTNGNDIKFGDNDKAIFGDAVGGDLQIYHDGSNSYINEQGTGNLKIIGSDISIEGSGETHATFVDDGAVTLYHNNAIKFATSAVGVSVTGDATVDQLNIDSVGAFGNFDSKATISTEAAFAGSDKDFRVKTTAGNVNHFFVQATTGNVGIGGSETTVFNGVGGDMKLVVLGNDSTTTVGNNSNSGIAVVNTNHTAGNVAGLHFARADTDYSPNYAGASIVAQFPEAQVTGQYPKGDLAFLTSTTTNSAPSEKMRILAAGGITFNGDTAAANALSDYEIGIWDPSFVSTGTQPTVSYSVQSGNYTKIGRLVTVNFGTNTSSVSGGSGELRISGLPFSIASGHYAGGRAGNMQNWSTSVDASIGGFVSGNQIILAKNNNVRITVSDLRTSNDSNQLWWTLSYPTDA